MSDVNCPHCGAEQEINHDDGYAYSEEETYQQDCDQCGRTFTFSVWVDVTYSIVNRALPH